jgi:hypothetical protein
MSYPDALPWLLEPADPGARYLALRDLVALPADDPELAAARKLAHERGPISTVLAGMNPEGYWATAGAGYNPKYTSTVWALILLAQLGASAAEEERIARGCAYLLDQALTPFGQFSAGGPGAPSGTIDCLQGNLLAALMALGCDDPRLEAAYDWMARTVTGEDIAPLGSKDEPRRWYAAKCGPRFACGANDKLSCAWGAVKVALAFSHLPAARRTPLIWRAITESVDFLLGVDPATAAYPSGWTGKPSGSWWKFGFPVFYVTDILQIAEALAALGYARDPRLANTLQLIRDKQDAGGRWALEYGYAGKSWGDYGAKKQPNKWVTLRALRVLKAAE